jgi:predicted lipoprotein
MAASREAPASRAFLATGGALAFAALLWLFPLFRIVPLHVPAGAGGAAAIGSFDARAAAARIWAKEIPAAVRHAAELPALVPLLRRDPVAARQAHAKQAGLGAAYYCVRGNGRVIARAGSHLQIALAGNNGAVVALRLGPVFGNTVRDGCGRLDLNAFPGLQEFNALSAELNVLVEQRVLPALREKAVIGAQVHFAGCAEAPETAAGPQEPLLVIVPLEAEVR